MTAFIKGNKSLTVFYDHKTYTIPLGHEADEVLKAISEDRWEDIPSLVDKATAVNNYFQGNVEVKNGVVYVKGDELPINLSDTIIQFMEEKAPYQPLIKFWERLKNNTSYRAVKELYGFLSANNIPILKDGRILTYKVVRRADGRSYRAPGTYRYGKVSVYTPKGGVPQFLDIHSCTVLQSVNDVVSIERRNVDEDCRNLCSYGLHVAGWSYVPHFGSAMSGHDVVLECAVDPADVVSVPSDFNNAKMRCAKYEILGINSGLTERRTKYVPDYDLNSDKYEDDDEVDDYYSDKDADDYEIEDPSWNTYW